MVISGEAVGLSRFMEGIGRPQRKESSLIGSLLAIGAVSSVLAFGGVGAWEFAPAQLLVVVAAVQEFWRRGWPSPGRVTLGLLAVLVAVPVLQLVPLPLSVVETISPMRVALFQEILGSSGPIGPTQPLTVNSHATQQALLKLICYFLVFLLAIRHYRLHRKPTLLVGTLIAIGLFQAVYGSIQYLTGWNYIFTYENIYYPDAATGTYINKNHFAGLLEMVLPFLFAGLLFRIPARQNRARSWWVEVILSPLSSHFLRDLLLFAILVIGLVLSRSRMGISAALAGLILVTFLVFLRTRRQSLLLVALLILAVPVAYSAWIGLGPVVERFEALGRPEALEQDRLPIWRDTQLLIRDFPLLGTGLGTYRWANSHYQTDKLQYIIEHAHSDYLEFASEIGIPAMALLFAGLWILVIRVARHALVAERSHEKSLAAGCAGALLAILVHGLVDFNLQIPANAYLFAWIAGTATALVSPQSSPEKNSAIHREPSETAIA